MFKLAVDFLGREKGAEIKFEKTNHAFSYSLPRSQSEGQLYFTKEMLQHLIEQGIIEKVSEPRWTDDDVKEIITMTKNMASYSPADILSDYKTSKGIK